MTIRQQNNDGFTLLEVLIAMAVFSIGILGVALMQVKAIQGNSFANHLTEGAVFASNKAEEILSTKYDDLKNDSEDSGKYHAVWTVKKDTPQAGSKTVTLIVSWDQNGQPKSFTLQTVKADKNYRSSSSGSGNSGSSGNSDP